MPLRQSSSPVRPPLDPLAADLARDVVGEHYPAESALFDAVLNEFQADPDRLVGSKALRAPVGMGVDLGLVTPYVLAAASFLGCIVAEKTAETALDAVRERVAKAWSARRSRRTGQPEPTGDGGLPTVTSDDDKVTVVVTVHLWNCGVDPTTAREVAERVVGKLLLPVEPRR